MSQYFKTGSGQNAFTVETRIGDYVPAYPLGAAEPTALVVTAPFMQTAANYARPNVNAVLSFNGSNAYFVDDDGMSDVSAGVRTWNRKWATVPASWSEPEEYAYSYPGFVTSVTGSAYNVTNIASNGAGYDISTPATGIAANDDVYVAVKFTRNSLVKYQTFTAKATAATSNVSVTVGNVFDGSGAFTSITGTIRKGNPGRTQAQTMVCGSRVQHDYALSNLTSLNTDLPLLSEFAPIDSTGNRVTVLSTGTATAPNTADYAALVTGGGEIIAEPSSRRRYMGNIYVRATRYIPAK